LVEPQVHFANILYVKDLKWENLISGRWETNDVAHPSYDPGIWEMKIPGGVNNIYQLLDK
ncbi:hypothetical protein NL526_28390, partial [Klebsiella pneumoniae]|nr:hypothetical protein [Klebsiella pneumoniae]